MKRIMRLYHTGFETIPEPDISIGRRNADFGQGFYLSDDREFSKRWAKQRKGMTACLNCYELDPEGLNIRHFTRNVEWFGYIFANRSGQKDTLSAYDVIIGPIANDTLYDTWGIITSGLIDRQQALELLSQGPLYEQTVIKTKKALAALRYVETVFLSDDEIRKYRETLRREEEQFQEVFLKKLNELDIG